MSIKLRNDVSDVSQLDARHQLHPWQAMGMNKPDHMVASKAEGIYIFDENDVDSLKFLLLELKGPLMM